MRTTKTTTLPIRVTFLGSGTSSGNPVPMCDCDVCRSDDPLDRRLRASILVEVGERPAFGSNRLTHHHPHHAELPNLADYRALLIDCGPDFREQALRIDLRHVTAVLLTHLHFDHCGGLDDLRIFSYAHPLPLYAEPEVARVLRAKYDYVFTRPYPGAPHLRLHELRPNVTAETREMKTMAKMSLGTKSVATEKAKTVATVAETPCRYRPFYIGGIRVRPIRLMHGTLPIVGYRIGGLAYLTDCTELPRTEDAALRGLHTLVIDALRWDPHRTHMSVDQAFDIVARLRPRHTWFTHMSHDIGLHHEAEERLARCLTSRGLPPGSVHFAYDGLHLDIS